MSSFRRSFVWFHHIYSKKKQQAIFRWSGELNLTGCMRTGKPGVVVVEGESEKVNRFVVQIKALNWQKMTVNATEEYTPTTSDLSTKDWIEAQRKFSTFERTETEKLLHLLPRFQEVGLEDLFWKGTRMDPSQYADKTK